MIYTSQGLMTSADLEEYRRDTDWYELSRRESAEDECEHLRQLVDDCDDCGPDDETAAAAEAPAVAADETTPNPLEED